VTSKVREETGHKLNNSTSLVHRCGGIYGKEGGVLGELNQGSYHPAMARNISDASDDMADEAEQDAIVSTRRSHVALLFRAANSALRTKIREARGMCGASRTVSASASRVV